MSKLVIATTNEGKLKELRQFLKKSDVELLSLNNFRINEVAETGATFMENSVLKASGYALQTKHWTLADDSGLEVEALKGAPGVLSSRYSGTDSTDQKNIETLLEDLAQTTDTGRLARFTCAVAVSDNNGQIRFRALGFCQGRIAQLPKGENGFGYDPVFIPDGFDKTFGELENYIKQRLSHRAKALRKIIDHLTEIPVF